MTRILPGYVALCALVTLTACGGSHAPVPKGVKVGKPYSINGKTYYPEYDPTYDETGIASWYGPGFHGKSTANGERFDTHDLTAAHPTLPMPSLVRVTNLQNGKSLVVRVNDRGPFARDRIIDLSREAAQRLGISGLAEVRVQYLSEETDQYIAEIEAGRTVDMFAYNQQLEVDKQATIVASTAPTSEAVIIESTQNVAIPGESLSGAAPIVSVTNNDLPVKGEEPSGFLIREAMADDKASPIGERGGEVILHSPNIPSEVPSVVSMTPKSAPKPAFQPVPAEAKLGAAGGYFIQVGSFSQEDNAHSMKSRIAQIAPADITSVMIRGASWWRLRAGPFETQEAANHALDQIRANGAPDARIIQ